MEGAPGLDAFQDQEVGRTGRKLNIGRPDHRPAIEVRGDLDVPGFGQARYLLGFQKTADPSQIHLPDGRSAAISQPRKVVLGGQPLSRRYRDGGRARHLGHFFGGVRGNRLFQPQGVIGLQPAGQPNRARRRHLAMGSEQQVGAVADGGAQLGGEGLAQGQAFQRQLAPVKGAVGTRRIKLQGGEAHLQIFLRPLGRQIRVIIDAGFVAGPGVDIGVGPQALVHLTAQQIIDRLVRRLADNIPARHFQGAEAPLHRQVWMLGEAG